MLAGSKRCRLSRKSFSLSSHRRDMLHRPGSCLEQHMILATHRQLDDAVRSERALGELHLIIADCNIVHTHSATLNLSARIAIGRGEARHDQRLKQPHAALAE